MTSWRNVIVAVLVLSHGLAVGVRAECPLDHYFLGQEEGLLFVDKSRIYQHGSPGEGYYPLSWSAIYHRWSVGEPGFSDTTDPAYGFPPEIELEGAAGVDYEIWFEILDISPDFKIQMNDGTWLDATGERYNLSDWTEHHVHMKYCAYVDATPAPDYPFYVTYRLVDDMGAYECTPPFSLVFNTPTPTVEATSPGYRNILSNLSGAEIVFEFHRPIAVAGGQPVTITDEATHGGDYYTGYFDYSISGDGLSLILTQIGGELPNETWLEIALTEHTRDAATDFAAVPFTHFVYAQNSAGDCDGDGDVDIDDFDHFATCMQGAGVAAGEGCGCADLDEDDDVDLADFAGMQEAFTGGRQ